MPLLGALLVGAVPGAARAETSTTAADRLEALEGKSESLADQIGELKPVVDALSKIKISGYIQTRWEGHQDSAEGVNAAGKPTNTSQFLVRRGRLKTTYAAQLAELMLQIDATGSGVVLKDAEATFIEPWTGLGLRLTGGQFKWPFGYEVLQSSQMREMPERALVIRKLFPGERDRGVRFQGSWSMLRLSAALVNGNGTQDPIYGANDQNAYKDLVARLGVDLDWLAIGVSGYTGRGLATKLGSATANPPTTTVSKVYRKERIGADAQVYFDVPALGGLALKGEVIRASEPGDATAFGWYVLAVQNVGEHLGVFARLDAYDPDANKDNDRMTTIGGGLQYYFSNNVKVSGVYEHLMSQVAAGASDPGDDILTFQLQGMF